MFDCPSCESLSYKMFCLQCGHSVCDSCLKIFQLKNFYFKCPVCSMNIIQKPFENLLLNQLLKQNLNVQAQKTQIIYKNDFLFQNVQVLSRNFTQLQFAFQNKILLIQEKAAKFPDFLGFKFVSSEDLFVRIQISGAKKYVIDKKLSFASCNQITVPIGPREKLFANINQIEIEIEICKIEIKLGRVVKRILSGEDVDVLGLSELESYVLVKEVLLTKNQKVVHLKPFQALLVKSKLLLKTVEFRQIGHMDFTFLYQLVKPQQQNWADKHMEAEDVFSQQLRYFTSKDKKQRKFDLLKDQTLAVLKKFKLQQQTYFQLQQEHHHLQIKTKHLQQFLLKFDDLNIKTEQKNFYAASASIKPGKFVLMNDMVEYKRNGYEIRIQLINCGKIKIKPLNNPGLFLKMKKKEFCTSGGAAMQNEEAHCFLISMSDGNHVEIE
uniref:Zinc finger, C3HC4 type (RING finger) domain-containing protein n=1 Tax=Trepomonas sp. PC1 TaxID=1076344 RepID=A0A146KEN2_9EUKA|eukprot:JAP95192.1 Zinc finger, C3HC4 type (RING finger) domain-containing protein [Trepomonas sp. PC1]